MVGWLGVLAKEIQPRRRIYPAVSTDSSVLRPLLAQFFQLLAGVERLKGRAEGRSIVSETGCSLVYFMRAARQREGALVSGLYWAKRCCALPATDKSH